MPQAKSDIERLKKNVKDVNENNMIFNELFMQVSSAIKQIQIDEGGEEYGGGGSSKDEYSELYNLITKIIDKFPSSDESTVTMILLDIIYYNILNELDIYSYSSEYISKYIKLQKLKKDFNQVKYDFERLQ